MTIRILRGDAREVLKTLPDESVDTCVSSPPYWGLRDYRTGTWNGGDAECDHIQAELRTGPGMAALSEHYKGGGKKAAQPKTKQFKDICGKCGATRTDAQIGLEPTPAEFVAELVAVFREVRRVLKRDGTVWLNLGDSYSHGGGGARDSDRWPKQSRNAGSAPQHRKKKTGVKPKDLIGIPWRVAFALQDDGWYLRQEIIWSKPNPIPESVSDRCTKSHETIFLFAKSKHYFFDATAIAEPAIYADSGRSSASPDDLNPERKRNDRELGASFRAIRPTRNKRSVWTVATKPFLEAHFAVFPEQLIEPCILAGTSAAGCCPFCGAQWERIVRRALVATDKACKMQVIDDRDIDTDDNDAGSNRQKDGHMPGLAHISTTLGWYPACHCYQKRDARFPKLPAYPRAPKKPSAAEAKENPAAMSVWNEARVAWSEACDEITLQRRSICDSLVDFEKAVPVVLDPFGGSGTTALVADRHHRDAILIELNPDYADMAERRLKADAPLFVQVIE